MSAQTLNCPMCGAASASDLTRCAHCGARLATIACPSCFGMIFLGAKFCSHCGERADRAELDGSRSQQCPRCRTVLRGIVLGESQLRECPRCEGIWADVAALEKIRSDREQQAAVLGMARPEEGQRAVDLERNIRYLPCPECKQLMNRVNFANCSHVVVDMCKQHGTWFDKEELRRIVEFIRGGGLDQARAKEIARLEEERRRANAARVAGAWEERASAPAKGLEWDSGFSAAAWLLKSLLR